uniref:Angiotensin-converting enzyme n=1 Tax=Hadrurus spadix TaxID=141984 RepID=A0A1W7R9Z8_9SCOR
MCAAHIWLIVFGFFPYCRIQPVSSLISDEGKAKEFLDNIDQQHREWCQDKAKELDYRGMWSYDWKHFSNPELRRAFQLLSLTTPASLDAPDQADLSKYQELEETMIGRIFGSKVCPYNQECGENEKKLKYSAINGEMDQSRDYNKRLYYWKAWRDATGKQQRTTYSEFVDVANKLRKQYDSYGDYWLREYETPTGEFLQELKRIRQDLLPLYKQLHAYVRRRLINVYGENKINSNGPIPEHLIGLIPQKWNKIMDVLSPYDSEFDVTAKMKQKGTSVSEMVELAEDFYRSLGTPELDEAFWRDSIFEKSSKMENCINEIREGCAGSGARIRMCTNATEYYLHLLLQLLGDAHQEKAVSDLHYPFQGAANPGFLVAIGRTADLSAWTETYLRSVGLWDESYHRDRDISVLLNIALENIPVIFNSLSMETWRIDVFDKVTPSRSMNGKYWEKRVKKEGVCPPVRRDENDFDPGAHIHISTHSPIIDYAVGGILQFQFHKALSQAAGCSEPLHKCSIYRSSAAGRKLNEMMELGKSKPWPEVLSILTNGQTKKMDAGALLEFFQPLYQWLQRENNNEYIGWVTDDVMQCPRAG